MKLLKLWKCSPLVFGCNSILFFSVYLLGRTPGSLGHAVFLHLDTVGAISGYSAMTGVGIGAYLFKMNRESRVVQYGAILSLIALILCLLGPL